MNKEVAEMWADALEAGEYQQGKSCLKDGDRFCCLGVLCDLHKRRTNSGRWSHNGSQEVYRVGVCGDEDDILLPHSVSEWAGVRGNCPFIDGRSIVDLNDTVGLAFPDLAALIRHYYASL